MIPKELDDLIKEYLTDGIISQAERKVLLRKAEKMGLDLDEVDLYITAQEQKVDNKVAAEKKAAIGKVCPKCGRQVESMTVRCECGYEFKNEKSVSSVQKLHEALNNIRLTSAEENEIKTSAFSGATRDKITANKKIDVISSFPVPNTKEDIIEFLALALPNSRQKGGLFGTFLGRCTIAACISAVVVICVIIHISTYNPFDFEYGPMSIYAREVDQHNGAVASISVFVLLVLNFLLFFTNRELITNNKLALAWKAKFDQVLMKGRSLRGDAEFQQQLDYYESMINSKR